MSNLAILALYIYNPIWFFFVEKFQNCSNQYFKITIMSLVNGKISYNLVLLII